MRIMQSVAQFQPQTSASGLSVVEADSTAQVQAVGVSAAWRKLLMQAEMAAPHLQVAAIEGEHGTGKHTLARYLYSRSPLANSTFHRRDAREWLATDADPANLSGFIYLDRADLLAPPGQGLLLGVLRAMQDRPPAARYCWHPRRLRCGKWPTRGCSCRIWRSGWRRYDLRFHRCGSGGKTLPCWRSRCWTASARATNSGRFCSVRARWRGCCNTTGREIARTGERARGGAARGRQWRNPGQ